MPTLTNSRSRLLGGGRLAVPVPTLGAELLTNNGFETGDPPSNWTAQNSATLSSVADPRMGSAGTKSMGVVSGSNSHVVSQFPTFTTGAWYFLSGWSKRGTATGTSIANMGDGGMINVKTATGWVQSFVVARGISGSSIRLFAYNSPGVTANYDDLSLKSITLASMFSTRPHGTHVTVKAQATVELGTYAGVVCNLDSASSPANFVFAAHEGVKARLVKCVAGTYTELISTAVTYSANAYVEIRRLAGTDTYRLFYAGSQVGTDQTITGMTGVLAGYFNTWSGNTLTGFSCVPSA